MVFNLSIASFSANFMVAKYQELYFLLSQIFLISPWYVFHLNPDFTSTNFTSPSHSTFTTMPKFHPYNLHYKILLPPSSFCAGIQFDKSYLNQTITGMNLFLNFLFQGFYFCLRTLLQAGQIRKDGTNCRLHIRVNNVW